MALRVISVEAVGTCSAGWDAVTHCG